MGGPSGLIPISETQFQVPGADVTLTFEQTDGGRAVRVRRGSNAPQLFQRMPAFAPTKAQLAAFGGTYRSTELDTDMRIAASDTALVLTGRRPGSLVMRPIFTDAFRGDAGVLEFSRDATGRVTGFVINAGRVRALRFDRIE